MKTCFPAKMNPDYTPSSSHSSIAHSTIPRSNHPTRQQLAHELLLYKMREYSEDGFCASWLDSMERDLWEAADNPRPSGRLEFTYAASCECRMLAAIAKGWWVYEDETQPDTKGPVFVTTQRWQQIRKTTTPAKNNPSEL